MQVVRLHVRGAAIRLLPRHDGQGMGWHLQIYGVGKYWHDQPFVGRAGLINHAQAGSYIGVGSKYGLLP
jgi:hypothetical protein